MKKNACLYCKGQLEEKLVTRVQPFQECWYLIENLPALVCQQCGETFYSPEVHDHVLDIVQSTGNPTEKRLCEAIMLKKPAKSAQLFIFMST